MASSFSRKSNSSASNQKPTPRRAAQTSTHRPGTSLARSSARSQRSYPQTGLSRSTGRSSHYSASSRSRYTGSSSRGHANLAKRGNVSIRRYGEGAGRYGAADRRPRESAGPQRTPSVSRAAQQRSQNVRSRAVGSRATTSHKTRKPRARLPRLSGWPARILLIVVLLGVLGFVAYSILFNSELFAATDIQIKGSEHISQETAERLIELPDNVTLFNVSDEQITQDLKKSPWVKGVDIKREFPHKLVITPTERTVAAIVYLAADDVAWAVGDDDTWIAPVSLSVALDADGNVVDATGMGTAQDDSGSDISSDGESDSSSDTSDGNSSDVSSDSSDSSDSDSASSEATQVQTADGYTLLSGEDAARAVADKMGATLFVNVGTDVSPSSGTAVKTEALLAGLKYVKGFSSDFLSQIKSFSVSSVQAVSCMLNNGVEVALGDAEDIQKKESVVTKLLEEQSNVTYINVRTPDAYTYRAAQL